MKHESSQALYRYWDSLRDHRAAPQRSAIEPAEISGILRDTFILESTSAGFPFRLAGTRLCSVFGRELKRQRFVELWHPDDATQLHAVLTAVTEDGRPSIIGATAEAGPGRIVSLEVLLLPLIQSGPVFDRIMGVAAPLNVPYWLGVDPIMTMRMLSDRILEPEQAAYLEDEDPQPLFARTLAPTPDAIARRERFVVLDGGKIG